MTTAQTVAAVVLFVMWCAESWTTRYRLRRLESEMKKLEDNDG